MLAEQWHINLKILKQERKLQALLCYEQQSENSKLKTGKQNSATYLETNIPCLSSPQEYIVDVLKINLLRDYLDSGKKMV